MWTIIAGAFLALHGLVHLLYAGQSRRLFELSPGLTWPEGAWAFSKFFGSPTTGLLATLALAFAALGFIAGGAGLSFQQAWWRPVAIIAATCSSLIFILFWDGSFRAWADKGGVGLLINLAVLFAILILEWRP